MRMRCGFTTEASAEQVLRAYTDFTDRRLETWRDTLRPEDFAVVDVGDTWAVVREGSLRMGVVLRYEWDDPGGVRWTLLESTFCQRGAGRLTVTPREEGGARVEIAIEEHGPKGVLGPVVLALKGLLGPHVLARASKRSLDRFAREDRAAS
ncbi:hypothetical protein SAMN05660657_04832 [Geodermatophilus amargosae]|uniref:Polyketide cyclase / dehydrase and lipid transport n=1 Tax=Geodermatophilus amargosae TaxID=1296565 RepID=A0A1I7CSU9_9ACTN|nr:SRPBCC family protein [Geodermatophilus amargosae]SFU02484.1 hypothetical protein SAMN05660657_04832 [Geodermatophilus amargosae]